MMPVKTFPQVFSAACERAPMPDPSPAPLPEHALLLGADDDVAVALRDLPPGLLLRHDDRTLTVTAAVPQGHKIAVRGLPPGTQVHKYGQTIGRTTREVHPGDHVHTHNLAMDAVDHAYEFGTARVSIAQIG